ncbi:lytic transglycosylase [Polymorphobacter glacialis]|uniref:Lytic transglycosylase n=2 Tax=Sandarakinorhabdus glacialis TaxID=1614636 RepID=A0A916ZNZ9_9SPHN|nr:lytic transglycosylase [Polymorphobacter glacialis]
MRTTLALTLLLTAAPLLAQPAIVTEPGDTMLTVTAERPGITARQRAVPSQLSPGDRATYARIFRDIDAGRYGPVEAALAAMNGGLLTETARAQLMVARGLGKQDRAELASWLTANRDLPQAQRIAQLAEKLPGADTAPLPLMPYVRPFRRAAYTAPPVESGPIDASSGAVIKAMLAADNNAAAESRWLSDQSQLSPVSRTQWAQRIAWSAYAANDNATALRLGLEAAKGPGFGAGQYAALGAWVAGLAAFRTSQYDTAAKAFDTVGTKSPAGDLAAAAAYWASRAHLAAGRPELVAPRLEIAVKSPNSFYGMLARRGLGLTATQDWAEPDFITADWNFLKTIPGARRAAALIEIGQIGLGDRELRYLAQTAPEPAYPALLRLAARLELPATQYQLAVRPPMGIEAPLSARYPAPDWVPARGWRVDRGLVFAHALQESTFVTTATSRAGAKGIMQLMPGTAKQVSREMATAALTEGAAAVVGDLTDPAFNIEVGQTYLEALRDMSYTQGLLPKVVAAYNAGPGSVQKWNATLDDRGDPLLFIESIPFKETRHYVEVVLRNYWMYALRDGVKPASMDALAANLWPKFPGMPGAPGIKRSAQPLPPRVAPVIPTLPVTPNLRIDEDDDVTVATL